MGVHIDVDSCNLHVTYSMLNGYGSYYFLAAWTAGYVVASGLPQHLHHRQALGAPQREYAAQVPSLSCTPLPKFA